ncbi:hypothetical protein PDIG_51520 [Penicillium digitatum PHI26]|uniref:Uncharacterized protein n=2 Tax=Penicillium digitatum TaxID=36651 RepID=K9FNV2_PEND2|nr:hypothetical protein PDIP_20720 [Penicillium digitatum Pd1]EKV11315.1 hypothetical protein PDIG_51520 [Penicillium digitatum PHI26]EKV19915.1 hypothetical protein PDIP_20720 [Penicillium digitatum Pd1]
MPSTCKSTTPAWIATTWNPSRPKNKKTQRLETHR